jgi:hypothetical protein
MLEPDDPRLLRDGLGPGSARGSGSRFVGESEAAGATVDGTDPPWMTVAPAPIGTAGATTPTGAAYSTGTSETTSDPQPDTVPHGAATTPWRNGRKTRLVVRPTKPHGLNMPDWQPV